MSDIFLTTEQVVAEMLADYKNITGIELAASNLEREEVIKAFTYSGSISMFYSRLRQVSDDTYPASSSETGLVKHLAARSLPGRAQPSSSLGVVRFPGVEGTTFGTGVQVKRALDGALYVSVTSGVVTGGYVDVTFQSLLTGAAQDLDQLGQEFDLITPIVGISATGTNQTQFANGRDLETPAEMLARIQAHDQDENSGGNIPAYEAWAREASSDVVTATGIKIARGIGTVDVVITAGTTDISAAVNAGLPVVRLPSVDLVAAVLAYILVRNPTTDDVQVVAPTEEDFNVTFRYNLYDETLRTQIDPKIRALIKIYIYSAVPQQKMSPSDVERIIDENYSTLIRERRCSDFSGGGPDYTVPNYKLERPGTLTTGTL